MGDQYPFYNPHTQQNHDFHQQHHQQPSHPAQLVQQFQQSQAPPHPQALQQPHQPPVHPGSVQSYPNTLQTSPVDVVDYGAQQYYGAPGQFGEPQQLSDANLARWFEQDADLGEGAHAPKSAVRMRRRAPAGADHVKHRRTRSGCYTCRNRRVKCDEARPICERCKKGSRECVYPEPPSVTTKTAPSKLGQSSKTEDDPGSSEEEFDDDDDALESPVAAPKADGSTSTKSRHSATNLRGISKKQSRNALSQVRTGSISQGNQKDTSLSPATDDSILSRTGKISSVSTLTSHGETPWSHLPSELQFYFDYHHSHLNHNFYFFKHDGGQFVHKLLPLEALKYEPLLYAFVGFAAYHHTIRKPKGRIPEFLTYYNKSVSTLRRYLQSGRKHTHATILTVLQLATFEEYLGDWVNLTAHQKAAYEMLVEIYSPDTIMKDETSRKIFDWYARFDLFVGLMASNTISISNEWFEAHSKWYDEKWQEQSSNTDFLLESLFSAHRLMGVDMAQLFGKLPKGEISIQDFMVQNAAIRKRIADCKARLDPLLESSDHKIMSFEGAPELDPDLTVVDPYQTGVTFQGPLFSANYLVMDWYAMDAMHKYQTALILQQQPPAELMNSAIEQCRVIDAMDLWPGSPPGAILPVQASLGLICLSFPKDEKHIMWCRRKLAKLEANGYIYAPNFRTKIAEHWSLPSVQHWWLDNEEGYTPIVKAIRSFIEERTIQPRTQTDQDIRNMKAMFSKLSYGDSPKDSPDSISSTNESSSGRLQYGSPQSGTSSSQPEVKAEFEQAFDNWDASGGIPPDHFQSQR